MADEFVIERQVQERSHTRIKVSVRALLAVIVGAGSLLTVLLFGIIVIENRTGLLWQAVTRSGPRSSDHGPGGIASGTPMPTPPKPEPRAADTPVTVSSLETATGTITASSRIENPAPAESARAATHQAPRGRIAWTTTTSSLTVASAESPSPETPHVVRARPTVSPAGLTRSCTPAIVRAGLNALRTIAGLDLTGDGTSRACRAAIWDSRPKRGAPNDRIRDGS